MSTLTPIKAIRAKCLDCCCGQAKEVRECPSDKRCSLYPYRMGKRPVLSEKLVDSLGEIEGGGDE